MKAIELPERLPRTQSLYVPPGEKDVNRLFTKLYEHEKNYYK